MLALQKGEVEVHSILDQKHQQTIEIPNDEPRHMSHQKDKFYIATKGNVFLLLWTPMDTQVALLFTLSLFLFIYFFLLSLTILRVLFSD